MCVYVTSCFLLKAMINVPLCPLTVEPMYLWGDHTTNTHTVWLSQPAKLLAWHLAMVSCQPSVDMAASVVSKAQSYAQLDELFK